MADDINTATGAVANILGIDDPQKAMRVMRELAQIRAAQIAKTPIPGKFDLEHAKRIHAALFRDFLPKKALGAIRVHEIVARGAGMHVHHKHVAEEYGKAYTALQRNRVLNPQASKRVAAAELAKHWERIHAVSPFRRGNLAVSKIMVERIAILAGHPMALDAKKLEQARLLLLSKQTQKLAEVLERAMTVKAAQERKLTLGVSLAKKQSVEKRLAPDLDRARRIQESPGFKKAEAVYKALHPEPPVSLVKAPKLSIDPEMRAIAERILAQRKTQEMSMKMTPQVAPGEVKRMGKGMGLSPY